MINIHSRKKNWRWRLPIETKLLPIYLSLVIWSFCCMVSIHVYLILLAWSHSIYVYLLIAHSLPFVDPFTCQQYPRYFFNKFRGRHIYLTIYVLLSISHTFYYQQCYDEHPFSHHFMHLYLVSYKKATGKTFGHLKGRTFPRSLICCSIIFPTFLLI